MRLRVALREPTYSGSWSVTRSPWRRPSACLSGIRSTRTPCTSVVSRPLPRELFGKAIAAYERVFVEKGGEMSVLQLRNVTAAQLQLGNVDEAIAFGERAIASHPEDASLLDYYARAVKEAGQITEAVAALAAIEEIDPDWPNLHLRMASWLIEDGRIDEAVPVLQSAVAHGSTPDEASYRIFSYAHTNYVQPTVKNYPRHITLIELAKQFDVSSEFREQYDFWHGYALYQHGVALQPTPETLESANRTRPMFQEALTYFQRGKGHADRTAGIEYQQYAESATLYIEIQDVVIARANRR